MYTDLSPAGHTAAIVWLDLRHALVARAIDGRSIVTEVAREADPEVQYLMRVVHEASGCDRVVVMGPDAARIDFEREYVALYQRPEQLIDVGVSFSPDRGDLFTQLRFIEPGRRG
jgi:hypothetical protein